MEIKGDVTISAKTSAYCDVYLTEHAENTGDNSDKYTIKLICESQPMKVGDDDGVIEHEITFVGSCEIEDFLRNVTLIAQRFLK